MCGGREGGSEGGVWFVNVGYITEYVIVLKVHGAIFGGKFNI